MLKDHVTLFQRLIIAVDGALITASFFLAYFLRSQKTDLPLPSLNNLLWLLALLVVTLIITLRASGMYDSFRLKRFREIIFITYQSCYISFFIFTATCYTLRIQHISRGFVFMTFIFATIFILCEKLILMESFRYLRKKGFNYRNVLIVGTEERALRFVNFFKTNREFGLQVIGLISDNPDTVGETRYDIEILGTLKDIPAISRAHSIDQVLFAVPYSWLKKIEEPIHYLETVGVKIDIAMDYFKMKLTHFKQTDFFNTPFLSYESTPQKPFSLLLKRFIDIILSGIGLIILCPFLICVAIAIKCNSKGPIFFTQVRAGLQGRKFTLYKFRSMEEDALEKLADLQQHNEMGGPVFKMQNDPRVTSLGKILRKLSIDELPQIYNVFRGDMSLVGPRPAIPEEIEGYDDWQRRRLSMRPGITCLWQVNGRNKIKDFNTWAALDLQYIDNWSMYLDMKILLKTIPVVLFGIGAK